MIAKTWHALILCPTIFSRHSVFIYLIVANDGCSVMSSSITLYLTFYLFHCVQLCSVMSRFTTLFLTMLCRVFIYYIMTLCTTMFRCVSIYYIFSSYVVSCLHLLHYVQLCSVVSRFIILFPAMLCRVFIYYIMYNYLPWSIRLYPTMFPHVLIYYDIL